MTFDKTLLDKFLKGEALSSIDELDKVLEYRNQCIQKILKPFITMPDTNYRQTFFIAYENEEGINKLFKEQFFDKKIIELGPGARPVDYAMTKFGVDEYVAVEPFSDIITKSKLIKPDNLVKKDGLTYLLEQNPESAIVVSFGMMCSEIWNNTVLDYFRFLGKEIHRVTPKESITVHVGDWRSYNPKIIFGDPGFKPIKYLDNEGTIMQMPSPLQIWKKE